MPKQSTENLLLLINSLNKAEKRHFRLFTSRKQDVADTLFMQLFELLVKTKEYDEKKILKKIPAIKLRQLPNLKANLYRQILTSLRHVERNNLLDISLRENLDFARILYRKGLYKASLTLLDKSKKIAFKNQLYSNAYNILEFEKHIESQHITGSMYPKAEQITQESDLLLDKLSLINKFSNLSLSLYGLYLKNGYMKSPQSKSELKAYFDAQMPVHHIHELGFYEKVFLFQSHVWYYHMLQDFANNYKYASKWVGLFHEKTEMIMQEPALYLKGMHNILNSLFMLERLDKFQIFYNKLLEFEKIHAQTMSHNEHSLFALFKFIHGINKIYLTGEYNEGVKFIPEIEHILQQNIYSWDLHRKLVFYYKIACVYFGNGNLEKTIFYLNKVTNQVYPGFKEDIQCYARILNLIAHFDLGNSLLVSYQIKSVYRYLSNTNEFQKVLREVFRFLKRTPGMLESELRNEFSELKIRLENLRNDPEERKPFLYLDIISWLESKIQNRPIQDIIKENLNSNKENETLI